jgi:hypothetical protein
MMGDMAAMNLQLLHLIETVVPVGEKQALATHIVAHPAKFLLLALLVRQRKGNP